MLSGASVTAGVNFSQTSVIYFCPGFRRCPNYRGVRYSGVSVRRELTVTVFLSVSSTLTADTCLPGCKQHGKCIKGFCVCDHSHYFNGYECARTSNFNLFDALSLVFQGSSSIDGRCWICFNRPRKFNSFN